MSLLTLKETFTIGGVLTDVTSVVLRDSTGVFGVKRNDTDEVVIVAGEVMVEISAGTYEYSFDEPASDLTYTYWVEWVYLGATYRDEHTVIGKVTESLAPTRAMTKYVNWLKTEFQPLTLATPDATVEQCVENAIRYFNTHSAYKISQVFDFVKTRVQLSAEFKAVVQVYPTKTTTYIWNDHPLWTLMGISVLDNVTTDLILMSEAFRNYRQYVGADFRWWYDKSEDPAVGGYLNIVNIPAGSSGVFVTGTKRILAEEDIKQEHILDWILRYSKALVRQIEGNTLRKSGIVDIKNDGDTLVTEGINEMKDLQKELSENGRWFAFAVRH